MDFGRAGHRGGRSRVGIGVLILALLHVPLPLPDYHSLNHHDRCDGEVCERHNHLLTWHSDSLAPADEQPVFHWHWVWPGREPVSHDADPSGLPVLHADGDGFHEPTIDVVPPYLPSGRWLSLVCDCLPVLVPIDFKTLLDYRECRDSDSRALPARLDRSMSVLQRWNC